MSQRRGGKLPWILLVLMTVLWIVAGYRSQLLQETVDALSGALDSTRASRAEANATQAAYVIDALIRLRADDVDGATATLETALEPLVRTLDDSEESASVLGARDLVRIYGESLSSTRPENPGLHTLTGARIFPAYEDGQLQGLRLKSIESGSAFAVAGLTEDDLITTVGELPLRSNRDAVSGMRLMKSGAMTTLRVRDAEGDEREVSWPPQL